MTQRGGGGGGGGNIILYALEQQYMERKRQCRTTFEWIQYIKNIKV